jgi:hypothetical protein
LERLHRSRLDVFRSIHVRLTGAETVNFDAFGFHGLGLAVNGKSEGWCEVLKSGRCIHEKRIVLFAASHSGASGANYRFAASCVNKQLSSPRSKLDPLFSVAHDIDRRAEKCVACNAP